MGSGQTKQKQLDQYGQLLSPQEKCAISSSFQSIASSQELQFFQEAQLQVLNATLYVYVRVDKCVEYWACSD